VEVSGSKSVANCGRSTYEVSMCFDNSLHFHEDVENPIRSSLRQASADFRQCRPDRPRSRIQRRSCQRAPRRHWYPVRGALEADARPPIWRFARRQIRSLAVPDGQARGCFNTPPSQSRITGTAVARTTTRMIVGQRTKAYSYRVPTTRKSRQGRTVRLEDLFYRSRWIRIGGWFILDKHSTECEQA
jgi:capsular polysaccharide biosynthesis protein